MLPSQHRRIAWWLVLAGLPGFVFCFFAHVCIAGHLRHPPYPGWQLASDVLWVALFAGAALLALRGRLPERTRLTVLLAVLAVSRLVLGSGGGTLAAVVELPVMFYLGIAAVRRLVRLRRSGATVDRPA